MSDHRCRLNFLSITAISGSFHRPLLSHSHVINHSGKAKKTGAFPHLPLLGGSGKHLLKKTDKERTQTDASLMSSSFKQ